MILKKLVWHEGLLHKLQTQFNIVGTPLKWIQSFLQGRQIQVRIGQTLSECKQTELGVPQGSILSPILFLTMVNEIIIMVNG